MTTSTNEDDNSDSLQEMKWTASSTPPLVEASEHGSSGLDPRGWTWFTPINMNSQGNHQGTFCCYYQGDSIHTTSTTTDGKISSRRLSTTSKMVVAMTASIDGKFVAVATKNDSVLLYDTHFSADASTWTETTLVLLEASVPFPSSPSKRIQKETAAVAVLGLCFGTVAHEHQHALAIVDLSGQLHLVQCVESHDETVQAAAAVEATCTELSNVATCTWSDSDSPYLVVGYHHKADIEVYAVVESSSADTSILQLGPTPVWTFAQPPPMPDIDDENDNHGPTQWTCCHLNWCRPDMLVVGYSVTLAMADDENDASNEAAMQVIELDVTATATPTWQVRSVTNLGSVVFSNDRFHCYFSSLVSLTTLSSGVDDDNALNNSSSNMQVLLVMSHVDYVVGLAAHNGTNGNGNWSVLELYNPWEMPIDEEDEYLRPTGLAVVDNGTSASSGHNVQVWIGTTDGAVTAYEPQAPWQVRRLVQEARAATTMGAPVVSDPTIHIVPDEEGADSAAASTAAVSSTMGKSIVISRALSEISEEPPEIIDEPDDDFVVVEEAATAPSDKSPSRMTNASGAFGSSSPFKKAPTTVPESSAPGFGSTASSIFGGGFGSASTPAAAAPVPFGSGFGSAASTPTPFGAFGSTPTPFGASVSTFGSAATGTTTAATPVFGQTSSLTGSTTPFSTTATPSKSVTTEGSAMTPSIFGSATANNTPPFRLAPFGSPGGSFAGLAQDAANTSTPAAASSTSPFDTFKGTSSSSWSAALATSSSSSTPFNVAPSTTTATTDKASSFGSFSNTSGQKVSPWSASLANLGTVSQPSPIAESALPTSALVAAPEHQDVVGGAPGIGGDAANQHIAHADPVEQPEELTEQGQRAANVFDGLDSTNQGWLAVERMSDLLEELGEGALVGDDEQLAAQIALVDPRGTGQVNRRAFIQWYITLSSQGNNNADNDGDNGNSDDSIDEEEREEERQKAKRAFLTVATSADGAAEPNFWIALEDFPRLFELLDTTYCEEDHARYARRLVQPDGKIYMNDFLNWYVVWIFLMDEGSDREDGDDDGNVAGGASDDAAFVKIAAVEGVAGETSQNAASITGDWGNMFAVKKGSWKCESCMLQNDVNATKCVACEVARAGSADPRRATLPTSTASDGSSIGPGGFSFGGGAVTTTGFGFGTTKSANQVPALESNAPADPVEKPEALTEQGQRAADVFDGLDNTSQGCLPVEQMSDLLDELGEGALGGDDEQLSAQIASVDPRGTGKVNRSAFIQWYVTLSAQGNNNADNDNNDDSVDEEEREEERQNAKRAFLTVATSADATRTFVDPADGTTEPDFWIALEDFPRLFELLDTTYCEEDHARYARRLVQPDGKIYMNDFLNWYVVWIFLMDEGSDREDGNGDGNVAGGASDDAAFVEIAAVEGVAGETPQHAASITGDWGNMFAVKKGSWKCESCMLQNDANATKCVACEVARAGSADPGRATLPTSTASDGSSIGPGGFSFGGGATTTASGFGFGNTNPAATTSGFGGFSFPAASSGTGFKFGVTDKATESSVDGAPKVPPATQSSANSGGFAFKSSDAIAAEEEEVTFEAETKPMPFSFPPAKTIAPVVTRPQETNDPGTKAKAPPTFGSPAPKTGPGAAPAPPLSSKAPPIFGSPGPKTGSDAAPVPPISTKAPSIFGSPALKSGTGAAPAPPLSTAAPPIFGSPALKSGTGAAPAPPLSTKAPSIFGSPALKSSSSAAPAPPLSTKAPPVFGSPAPKSSSSAAPVPPISTKAPSIFGSPALKSGTGAAPAPPLSSKAPPIFGSPTPKTGSSAAPVPPISTKAPSIFGSPALKSGTSAAPAPPLSTKTPPTFGSPAQKSPAFAAPRQTSIFGSPAQTFGANTPLSKSANAIPTFGSTANAPTAFGSSAASQQASLFGPQTSTFGASTHLSMKAPTFGSPASKTINASSTLGSSAAPTLASRSERKRYSKSSEQFINLVETMNQALTILAKERCTESDQQIRDEIEMHVAAMDSNRVQIANVFDGLETYKGRSASAMGRKATASRNVADSQRLIQRLSSPPGHHHIDDFVSQPLDIQSESRRRELTAFAMHTKRRLDIGKSRLEILSSLSGPDGRNKILASALDLHNRCKKFDSESKQIESRGQTVASLHIRSPRQLRRSPLFAKPTRFNLGALSSPRMLGDSLNENGIKTWDAIEMSFSQLPAPRSKVFDLESDAALPMIQAQNQSDTNSSSRQEARVVTVGSSKPPLFSPPLALKARDGWSAPTNENRLRMQQVPFSSPSELLDTTLASSAREALADYGTTPEKVNETLSANKRGMPTSRGPSFPQTPFKSSSTKSSPSRKSGDGQDQGPPASAAAALSIPASTATIQKKPAIAPPTESLTAQSTAANPRNRKSSRDEDDEAQSDASKTPALAFNSMASMGASLFASSEPAVSNEPQVPDYHAILTEFYQKHNPSKVPDAGSHLERYKGREREMFGKLAQKYKVPNPLDSIEQPNAAVSGTKKEETPLGLISGAPVFPTSSGSGRSDNKVAPFGDAKLSNTPFAMSSGPSFPSTPFSSATAPAPAFGPSTLSPPFGQAAAAPFGNVGQGMSQAQSPFTNSSSTPSAQTFLGKTPRELLTQFYQEKNPSKIAEVEKLLQKYQGEEEQLFRNLAKKYGLDPAVFGVGPVAPTPPAAPASGPGGFGSPPPGIAGSALAFGQPTPLAGPGMFGSPAPAPFGTAAAAATGGGGAAAPTTPFGQGFGSGSVAATSTPFGQSFGALAQSPSTAGGFGSLAAQVPPGGSTPGFGSGGFGSTTTPTPFSPFGAPRR